MWTETDINDWEASDSPKVRVTVKKIKNEWECRAYQGSREWAYRTNCPNRAREHVLDAVKSFSKFCTLVRLLEEPIKTKSPWTRWINGGPQAWISDNIVLFLADNLWTASIKVTQSPKNTKSTTLTTTSTCPHEAIGELETLLYASGLPVTNTNDKAFSELPSELI